MKTREHERMLAAVERRHAEQIRRLREQHAEEVAALRERIAELEHAHSTAVAAYRAEKRKAGGAS